MAEILIYSAGLGGAMGYAEKRLRSYGIPFISHPSPEITHLLLDVPCREIPEGLLERLPESVTIVGGNLTMPELEQYPKIDLLKLDTYLAQNASITAECALRVAAARIRTVFSGSSVLVIGWGRIGKCLSALLQKIGCHVTVAARKPEERAILEALGYRSADPGCLENLSQYSILFNTAPAPVLSRQSLRVCPDTLKIDLASKQGLDSPDVIWARGLPGLYAPESSGYLIADTFMKEAGI